ncbi:MAG TPA: Ig-like domain-containing protein, partial [Urbifossiella sp.]|nr:Ig-like domain-containing protein [Urbifossiella sp.]
NFVVTTDDDALFAPGGLPAVDPATGTLTYTPAVDAFGTAHVSVRLHDDGGTLRGGQDTSAAQTFAITINLVNHAPAFTAGADQTVAENAGPRSVAGWATGISAGPPSESGQHLDFVVTTDNDALFAPGGLPAIDPTTGALTYTPAADAFGVAHLAVWLHDDGGTAHGGQDTSAARTVAVTVLAPAVAAGSAVTTPVDTPVTLTLGASDPNTPPRPLTYIITAPPAHGTLGPVTGNTVVYTPAAGYSGPDGFQFKVHTDAGDSNAATVSLTVVKVSTSGVAVGWGTQTAAVQTAADGVRLLPPGRATDLPWLNVNLLVVTFDRPVTLAAGDVTVWGVTGGSYGPATISGSGTTTLTITLAKPVSNPDRLTVTFGNARVAAYSRRLDILPGDTNDDGVVNTTDGGLILNNQTPAHAYQSAYDFDGNGAVNTTDFNLYRPRIGTVLPTLPPQLAAGGPGPGGAPAITSAEVGPVLAAAVDEWAASGISAADVARLRGVHVQVTVLPAGYLGGTPIGGDTVYLSADAAGYGWFVDPALVGPGLVPSSPPAGREDLLTVLLHELGHTLGLGDLDPAAYPTDLMAETLATGVRRAPSALDVSQVAGPGAAEVSAGVYPTTNGNAHPAALPTPPNLVRAPAAPPPEPLPDAAAPVSPAAGSPPERVYFAPLPTPGLRDEVPVAAAPFAARREAPTPPPVAVSLSASALGSPESPGPIPSGDGETRHAADSDTDPTALTRNRESGRQ